MKLFYNRRGWFTYCGLLSLIYCGFTTEVVPELCMEEFEGLRLSVSETTVVFCLCDPPVSSCLDDVVFVYR
jgi:hypothetical protein